MKNTERTTDPELQPAGDRRQGGGDFGQDAAGCRSELGTTRRARSCR